MDSPGTSQVGSARSSVIDSIRGSTLAGVRIPKEELRKKIKFPQYIRLAVREAIQAKDVESPAVSRLYDAAHAGGAEPAEPPEFPLVVFINSKSGGRHGPELKARLKELMADEQIFDLQVVKPHEFVQYGLYCLEKFASLGDGSAAAIREKLRIVVAGGDGTVGWVLGCLGELNKQGRLPVPPTGIIPLGTGNDLSRSFNWGGSFPFNWKSTIKRTLDKIANGPIGHLDRNYKLKRSYLKGFPVIRESFIITLAWVWMPRLPMVSTIYAMKNLTLLRVLFQTSCKQGWFFTPCSSDPGLRCLMNILRIYVKKVNCSEWEQIPVPSSVRSVVVLNLPSYGSGRNPWGNLKTEYLEKRGFVEAHADDGLLEVFGLKHGWHASMVMAELISAKHIAQASAIRFELRGGEWTEAYMQIDGEPWKQPMNKEFSTFVEMKRVPRQSVMVKGE